jgi:nuclear protein localization family protein 4
MVDHVEIESAEIINSFMSHWRTTGAQRIGFLYGRYEPYEKVPLGIKAVVSAIYEPTQAELLDGVAIEPYPDPKEAVVDEVAAKLGLKRVSALVVECDPPFFSDSSRRYSSGAECQIGLLSVS